MTAFTAQRLQRWRKTPPNSSFPKGFRSLFTTPRTCSSFSFYQNRQLERYATKEAKRLTLRQLLFFGRSLTEEKILTSANYVRSELPIRIAHRIRDLQALPYVVVTQEGVDKVYKLYWAAFEKFSGYPPITNMKENAKFCEFVGGLLDDHAVIIPNLSLGLSLSSPYLPPDKLDGFMRRMLVSRISRRVLAEHHISLSKTYHNKDVEGNEEPRIGIIYPQLDVKRCIDRCTDILRGRPLRLHCNQDLKIEAWPAVHVEGHLDAKFAYIRDHFEYIVFELLKNAMTATVLKHHEKGLSGVPSIHVTIVAGDGDISLRISDEGGGLSIVGGPVSKPSDLFSFSHVRNASRLEGSRIGALRTASEEGLRATVQEQVLHWQKQPHRYANDRERDSSRTTPLQSRIGIGLPMSNIYATYFGGSLELVSLDGWGTDVFLRLPKLGTNLEGIEV